MDSSLYFFKEIVRNADTLSYPFSIFKFNGQMGWADSSFISLKDNCLRSYFGDYIVDLIPEGKSLNLCVSEEDNFVIIDKGRKDKGEEFRKRMYPNTSSFEDFTDSVIEAGPYFCVSEPHEEIPIVLNRKYSELMKEVGYDKVKYNSPSIYFLKKHKIIGIAWAESIPLKEWKMYKKLMLNLEMY